MSTVLAHELLSDWGRGAEGKTKIRDAKVHQWGPNSSQGDSSRKLRAEGRGQSEHLLTCRAGGRAGLGLGVAGCSCCFSVCKELA